MEPDLINRGSNTQNTINGTIDAGVAGSSTGTVFAGAQTTATAPVQTEQKASNEKKKGQWMWLASVLCLLVACGGVGFGIWAMMDGNQRVEKINSQVTTLQNQNASLEEQIAKLEAQINGLNNGKSWATTEVKDGVFYVLGEDGEVIAESDVEGLVVEEILSCEASDDNTVLTCTVNTSEGEGWFLYDVYGDELGTSFGE